MAATNGAIITNKGQELIADSQANQIPIEWTKMSIGGGVLEIDPIGLIDLVNKIMDIDVTSITKDGKAFTIRGNFTNVGFTQDTDFREIGLYAKTTNSPECLYAYVNAGGGEVIPAESSGRIQRVLDVVSTIGNGLDITFSIDSTLFVTVYDLEEGLALKEPAFTKKTGWNLDISHLVSSTSQILVASALAVKTAYDKAVQALGVANTNINAIQNNTEQIENLSKNTGNKIYDLVVTSGNSYSINENIDISNFKIFYAKAVSSKWGTSITIVVNNISYYVKETNTVGGSVSQINVTEIRSNKVYECSIIDGALIVSGSQEQVKVTETKANEAYALASSKESAFSKNNAFNKSFSHGISSTSKILVASAYAVKLAYDKGKEALNLATTNKDDIKALGTQANILLEGVITNGNHPLASINSYKYIMYFIGDNDFSDGATTTGMIPLFFAVNRKIALEDVTSTEQRALTFKLESNGTITIETASGTDNNNNIYVVGVN